MVKATRNRQTNWSTLLVLTVIFVSLCGGAQAQDTTPDNFDFTDKTGVAVNTQTESDIVQVTGMDNGTAISIDGSGSYKYRVCNDDSCSGVPAFIDTGSTIDAGKWVQLQLTSSSSMSTATVATLTVGTLAVDWSVTTTCDTTPQVFTTVGDNAYQVPAGCDTITIEAFGGGGGGSDGGGMADGGAGGGGGSGVERDSDTTVIIAAGGGGGGGNDDISGTPGDCGSFCGAGGGGGYAKADFSTSALTPHPLILRKKKKSEF